jgi:transcriptional regulator with XRE-family HTH domain
MTPPTPRATATPKAEALANAFAHALGAEIREERRRRGWRLADLAARSGVAIATIHRIEAGQRTSIATYCRISVALNMKPTFTLLRARAAGTSDVDPVHAAMGEAEAMNLRARDVNEVLLDEPYQHYQFAGRADVLAIDRARRALLHIENRTRFPDLQAFAGSYNAKRAYLAADLARRLGISGGFTSVTHVVAALWSAEVLHVVRLRMASFEAICPDPTDAFAAWWDGDEPRPGESSSLVLFDPLPGQRRSRRRWVGLGAAAGIEPRYRGYADALDRLRAAGRA